MKKLYVAFFVAVAALVSGQVMASNDASSQPLGERSIFSDRAIQDRIKPVGEVCEQGQNCGGAEKVASADSGSKAPRSGKEIYTNVCSACHGTGALGAPKFGNKKDWAPRIAKGMPTLLKHALNGFNSMPPHGTCSDCSEAEIKNAIEYMTSHSK